MVSPFGVSVGDFIATIAVIRKIVDALADSHGSASEFRELLERLDSLHVALEHLQNQEWEDEAFADKLRETTLKFNKSIAAFHRKIAKFQPSLQIGGTSSKWKDTLRKIQYTFIKDDVSRLEVELLLHVGSVQMLVESAKTIQLNSMRKELQVIKERMISAEAKLEATHALQLSFSTAFAQCATEIRGLLLAIFNAVLLANGRTLLALPRGIRYNSPLTLHDASGKYFPVQLEWTSCWEAFFHALQFQFKGRPGFEAVRARRYKLQDGSRPDKWTEIDTEKPFDLVFTSGGKWDQLMVFPYDPEADAACAKCGWPERKGIDLSRVKCQNPDCDLSYSRAAEALDKVLSFPSHYQVQGTANVAEDHDLAQDASEACLEPKTNDATPGVEFESDDNILPSAGYTLRLDDFKSVYFSMSAPVHIRMPSGIWHVVPWPVAKSFQRFRRLVADQLCIVGLRDRILLRFWGFQYEITEETWEQDVYSGMVVELSVKPALAGADASSMHSPTLTCQLCNKTFFSRATLDRHTQMHLRKTPCPAACDICGVS